MSSPNRDRKTDFAVSRRTRFQSSRIRIDYAEIANSIETANEVQGLTHIPCKLPRAVRRDCTEYNGGGSSGFLDVYVQQGIQTEAQVRILRHRFGFFEYAT